ncbi:armadillo repeat-containing protein 8-like isoform X1 [Impatiens glandulifera]|uniref:armadillo repeat-containing protein 8-like isoform X1 n=1 Tax=Impatiens glandulifera TaxID=253017 RepID=UPI001FB0DAD7|nr:armadillo repeat-containing protein 8-like isoform X1 [Impatiens glandulifera]
MPTYAATLLRPDDLIIRLTSSASDGDDKLKALRYLKNQIIGNRTKKLSYIKLGAVPAVVSILSDSSAGNCEASLSLLVQAVATIGSFACGLDTGVKAVIDAEALPILFSLINYPNEKIVDAGTRSLKLIYQSKLAPRYNFFQEKNMESLLLLLNSENENVSGLGASIITHSCRTSIEQKALSETGVLKKLVSLLGGSLCQREASLESLATITKGNPEVISQLVGLEEKALSIITELTKDKYPRIRLLACVFLLALRNTSPCYLEDTGITTKLVLILLDILDDPGQVGDEAPFALSNLVAGNKDLQNLAFEANAVDKLCDCLQKAVLQPRRVQGIFLALAGLCSTLEKCRSRLLSLQVFNLVNSALTHRSSDVHEAVCIFFKCISRSIKVHNPKFLSLSLKHNTNPINEIIQNLSADHFINETNISLLVELLNDTSTSVQIAALGAISNIVIDFTTNKLTIIQCGGLRELVQLSKSMDSSLRLNAVWALRNLIFLTDRQFKEVVMLELTSTALLSLICDSETSVQEQALAFVRNLVDGPLECIDYVFAEGGLLLQAVCRQIRSALKDEVLVQGLYILCNVASGNEFHKEAVMQALLYPIDNSQPMILRFLQSSNSQLQTVSTWAIINLISPSSPGSSDRAVKLKNIGIIPQLKILVNDSCLDVKLRVKTALGLFMNIEDGAAE